MLYVIIYILGWIVSAPILFAYLSTIVGFDPIAPHFSDILFSSLIISMYPLWIAVASVVGPLKLLFAYAVIPLANKILKYFE